MLWVELGATFVGVVTELGAVGSVTVVFRVAWAEDCPLS